MAALSGAEKLKASAFTRDRVQAENRLGDDSQGAQRSRRQLGQVIAGDVFHHLAAALGERAIRQSQGDPDDQVAQRAETDPERAAVIRGQNPSYGCFLGPKRIERQSLAVLRQSLLQLPQRATGFDGGRHVAPRMFHDASSAAAWK